MPRFTIDFDTVTDTHLTEIANQKDITKAEIVRRALALYMHLEERLEAGMKLAITDNHGAVVADVVFI